MERERESERERDRIFQYVLLDGEGGIHKQLIRIASNGQNLGNLEQMQITLIFYNL
jgi:hypothetical protein